MKTYKDIISESVAEGFVKDIFKKDSKKYPGLKGKIKEFIDWRREQKHYKDKGDIPSDHYDKLESILAGIEKGLKE